MPSAQKRFRVLKSFGQAAVLDRETGLVWERIPNTSSMEWTTATVDCPVRFIGGRKGWRLPTVEELGALLVETPTPGLPEGHPFTVEPSEFYWSISTATTIPPFAGFPGLAWVVAPGSAVVAFLNKLTGTEALVWCVRGPGGYDGGNINF